MIREGKVIISGADDDNPASFVDQPEKQRVHKHIFLKEKACLKSRGYIDDNLDPGILFHKSRNLHKRCGNLVLTDERIVSRSQRVDLDTGRELVEYPGNAGSMPGARTRFFSDPDPASHNIRVDPRIHNDSDHRGLRNRQAALGTVSPGYLIPLLGRFCYGTGFEIL